MKSIICATLILLVGSPAKAVDTSKADQHFSLGHWQQAENEYMTLYENSQKLGDTYTQVDLHKKLDGLYKTSGWGPLNHYVKNGIIALNPPPPKPSLLEQLGGTTGPSYPPVYGKVADYLINYTKKNFDRACRDKVPGYLGSTGYTGFVFQLPDGNYSVVSSCKASISDGSGTYNADLTCSDTVQLKSPRDEPRIIERTTSVSRIESEDEKRKDPNSFSEFAKKAKEESESRRMENAKAAEAATKEANQREAQALQQLRDRERAAEGSSYMSRYNSR